MYFNELLKGPLLSSFRFAECVCVCVHVYMCTHVHKQHGRSKDNHGYYLRVLCPFVFYLDRVSNWHKAYQADQDGWPESLQDSPVSTSLELRLQVQVTVPGFLTWTSGTGHRSSSPTMLLMELSAKLQCWFVRTHSSHILI